MDADRNDEEPGAIEAERGGIVQAADGAELAGADLRIPESATDEEAAAIAAAIGAYLSEERESRKSREGSPRAWVGRRWPFAGRTERLSGRAARAPDGAPAEAWTAAGRADRF